jgi:5-oxoprolinase (ATP-hydrolysing) subunit A
MTWADAADRPADAGGRARDNWTVPVVDLNADLAEGETLSARDGEVLAAVTSVSIACGFHAGGRTVMRETAAACVASGAAIGAHVSYRDRDGFGRRDVEVPSRVLLDDIVEQCAALVEEAGAVGGTVDFVKPHGALYHRMGVDETTAAAVVHALVELDVPVLVAQDGSAVVGPARAAGVRIVREGFPDRGYLADGRLAHRSREGALVTDPDDVGRRALSLVGRGGIEALTGEWTAVAVDTLCIHGDAPGAAATARRVRAVLDAAGVTVRSFVDGGRGR